MPQSAFLTRQAPLLRPDPGRVIVRSFRLTAEPLALKPGEKTRANHIVDRVMALDPEAAAAQLAEVLENFDGRHRNLLARFEARADEMEPAFAAHPSFTLLQRRLVGAYFMHEYSFEAAALFNPSIVPHPDQSGVAAGSCRFIVSLRAVGEGHVSSLTFRSGIVSADGTITVDRTERLATLPRLVRLVGGMDGDEVEIAFSGDEDLSERVIFPVTPAQANGIEDARFVAFDEGGGSTIYYATYTAYSGSTIRSELIETRDFRVFNLSPLAGTAARNKGMGLFPRKIDGRYAMIARQDNENLYLIYSDDLRIWNGGEAILRPVFPWEFVQIGNCGAPIELDEGWLLLMHGVGPVRRYSIGAALLDKNDPSKVLGRSHRPLLRPEPAEREGYVPNVVYTCGAMRHGDQIILPYAVSDTFTNFATIRIDDLLKSLD
ncbi:glycoside hydrolase family 130 protein [Kaistia geumhonensis]|uniref:GH43/DUF377 family glycosyl hydrolase n=1 Tax=Kaistia geumhonensis TaxID=410839 RepID=A0ABU0MAT2_9HYPH|nr:glycoside hydrolase family 130 protein [Kaistia geumhonensis]MCX5481021.1 glycoside hydrolase family 130 protein [Kaistia geumhonensis]MDQ0518078.1 putative GH43/DUF377 family glycosyl hydrolase [Kaistia geumhonensis]